MSTDKGNIEPGYLGLHVRPFLRRRQEQPGVLSSSSEVQVRQAMYRLQSLLPLLLLPPLRAPLPKPLELRLGLIPCEGEPKGLTNSLLGGTFTFGGRNERSWCAVGRCPITWSRLHSLTCA